MDQVKWNVIKDNLTALLDMPVIPQLTRGGVKDSAFSLWMLQCSAIGMCLCVDVG